MTDKYIVDTHALVWSLAGDKKLGSKVKAAMDNPNSELVLPVIALAEAVDIVRKGRTKIPDAATLLNDVFADARFEIYPLTVEILLESENALVVPEIHDRLITATALSLEKQGFQVAVLTKDSDIIASKLVEIIW
ncbi:MAG: PIN domain-containing protein [Pyrinomonadaceae bacterium]|nr:PIN domain-containing protein [Pyrinomonadaceae bacterium]